MNSRFALSTVLKTVLAVLSVVLVTCVSFAQDVPHKVSYQGLLVDAAGKLIADGSHVMKVTLYSDSAGTNTWWTSTFNVTTSSGIFNVVLGDSGKPLPSPIMYPIWMGVAVESSPEMRPLTELVAAPYALGIADSAISTSKLQSNSVTADKIGQNFLGSLTFNHGDYTSTKGKNVDIFWGANTKVAVDTTGGNVRLSVDVLGGGTLNDVRVGDGLFLPPGGQGAGYVTIAIASQGVQTYMIADSSVTNPKLATGAVDSRVIQDGSIQGVDIANNTVTGTNIKDGTITGVDIAIPLVLTRNTLGDVLDVSNTSNNIGGTPVVHVQSTQSSDGTPVMWLEGTTAGGPVLNINQYSTGSTSQTGTVGLNASSAGGPALFGTTTLANQSTSLDAPIGVEGVAATSLVNGTGVAGMANNGSGSVQFGVTGVTNAAGNGTLSTPALQGTRGSAGVYGSNTNTTGGSAQVAAGVWGNSSNSWGVYGISGANGRSGVHGETYAAGPPYSGVRGVSLATTNGIGVSAGAAGTGSIGVNIGFQYAPVTGVNITTAAAGTGININSGDAVGISSTSTTTGAAFTVTGGAASSGITIADAAGTGLNVTSAATGVTVTGATTTGMSVTNGSTASTGISVANANGTGTGISVTNNGTTGISVNGQAAGATTTGVAVLETGASLGVTSGTGTGSAFVGSNSSATNPTASFANSSSAASAIMTNASAATSTDSIVNTLGTATAGGGFTALSVTNTSATGPTIVATNKYTGTFSNSSAAGVANFSNQNNNGKLQSTLTLANTGSAAPNNNYALVVNQGIVDFSNANTVVLAPNLAAQVTIVTNPTNASPANGVLVTATGITGAAFSSTATVPIGVSIAGTTASNGATTGASITALTTGIAVGAPTGITVNGTTQGATTGMTIGNSTAPTTGENITATTTGLNVTAPAGEVITATTGNGSSVANSSTTNATVLVTNGQGSSGTALSVTNGNVTVTGSGASISLSNTNNNNFINVQTNSASTFGLNSAATDANRLTINGVATLQTAPPGILTNSAYELLVNGDANITGTTLANNLVVTGALNMPSPSNATFYNLTVTNQLNSNGTTNIGTSTTAATGPIGIYGAVSVNTSGTATTTIGGGTNTGAIAIGGSSNTVSLVGAPLNVNNSASAGNTNIGNASAAGSVAITAGGTNNVTVTAPTASIVATTANINNSGAGVTNIGSSSAGNVTIATSSSTSVGVTGTTNINTGSSSSATTVGNTTSGGSVIINTSNANSTTVNSGSVSISASSATTGNVGITASGSSGAVNINTGSVANGTNIGNTASTTAIVGPTNINTGVSASLTTIGNATTGSQVAITSAPTGTTGWSVTAAGNLTTKGNNTLGTTATSTNSINGTTTATGNGSATALTVTNPGATAINAYGSAPGTSVNNPVIFVTGSGSAQAVQVASGNVWLGGNTGVTGFTGNGPNNVNTTYVNNLMMSGQLTLSNQSQFIVRTSASPAISGASTADNGIGVRGISQPTSTNPPGAGIVGIATDAGSSNFNVASDGGTGASALSAPPPSNAGVAGLTDDGQWDGGAFWNTNQANLSGSLSSSITATAGMFRTSAFPTSGTLAQKARGILVTQLKAGDALTTGVEVQDAVGSDMLRGLWINSQGALTNTIDTGIVVDAVTNGVDVRAGLTSITTDFGVRVRPTGVSDGEAGQVLNDGMIVEGGNGSSAQITRGITIESDATNAMTFGVKVGFTPSQSTDTWLGNAPQDGADVRFVGNNTTGTVAQPTNSLTGNFGVRVNPVSTTGGAGFVGGDASNNASTINLSEGAVLEATAVGVRVGTQFASASPYQQSNGQTPVTGEALTIANNGTGSTTTTVAGGNVISLGYQVINAAGNIVNGVNIQTNAGGTIGVTSGNAGVNVQTTGATAAQIGTGFRANSNSTFAIAGADLQAQDNTGAIGFPTGVNIQTPNNSSITTGVNISSARTGNNVGITTGISIATPNSASITTGINVNSGLTSATAAITTGVNVTNATGSTVTTGYSVNNATTLANAIGTGLNVSNSGATASLAVIGTGVNVQASGALSGISTGVNVQVGTGAIATGANITSAATTGTGVTTGVQVQTSTTSAIGTGLFVTSGISAASTAITYGARVTTANGIISTGYSADNAGTEAGAIGTGVNVSNSGSPGGAANTITTGVNVQNTGTLSGIGTGANIQTNTGSITTGVNVSNAATGAAAIGTGVNIMNSGAAAVQTITTGVNVQNTGSGAGVGTGVNVTTTTGAIGTGFSATTTGAAGNISTGVNVQTTDATSTVSTIGTGLNVTTASSPATGTTLITTGVNIQNSGTLARLSTGLNVQTKTGAITNGVVVTNASTVVAEAIATGYSVSNTGAPGAGTTMIGTGLSVTTSNANSNIGTGVSINPTGLVSTGVSVSRVNNTGGIAFTANPAAIGTSTGLQLGNSTAFNTGASIKASGTNVGSTPLNYATAVIGGTYSSNAFALGVTAGQTYGVLGLMPGGTSTFAQMNTLSDGGAFTDFSAGVVGDGSAATGNERPGVIGVSSSPLGAAANNNNRAAVEAYNTNGGIGVASYSAGIPFLGITTGPYVTSTGVEGRSTNTTQGVGMVGATMTTGGTAANAGTGVLGWGQLSAADLTANVISLDIKNGMVAGVIGSNGSGSTGTRIGVMGTDLAGTTPGILSNNASTPLIGVYGVTSGTGALDAGVVGEGAAGSTGFRVQGITTGNGVDATTITTGNGVNLGGAALTTGTGVLVTLPAASTTAKGISIADNSTAATGNTGFLYNNVAAGTGEGIRVNNISTATGVGVHVSNGNGTLGAYPGNAVQIDQYSNAGLVGPQALLVNLANGSVTQSGVHIKGGAGAYNVTNGLEITAGGGTMTNAINIDPAQTGILATTSITGAQFTVTGGSTTPLNGVYATVSGGSAAASLNGGTFITTTSAVGQTGEGLAVTATGTGTNIGIYLTTGADPLTINEDGMTRTGSFYINTSGVTNPVSITQGNLVLGNASPSNPGMIKFWDASGAVPANDFGTLAVRASLNVPNAGPQTWTLPDSSGTIGVFPGTADGFVYYGTTATQNSSVDAAGKWLFDVAYASSAVNANGGRINATTTAGTSQGLTVTAQSNLASTGATIGATSTGANTATGQSVSASSTGALATGEMVTATQAGTDGATGSNITATTATGTGTITGAAITSSISASVNATLVGATITTGPTAAQTTSQPSTGLVLQTSGSALVSPTVIGNQGITNTVSGTASNNLGELVTVSGGGSSNIGIQANATGAGSAGITVGVAGGATAKQNNGIQINGGTASTQGINIDLAATTPVADVTGETITIVPAATHAGTGLVISSTGGSGTNIGADVNTNGAASIGLRVGAANTPKTGIEIHTVGTTGISILSVAGANGITVAGTTTGTGIESDVSGGGVPFVANYTTTNAHAFDVYSGDIRAHQTISTTQTNGSTSIRFGDSYVLNGKFNNGINLAPFDNGLTTNTTLTINNSLVTNVSPASTIVVSYQGSTAMYIRVASIGLGSFTVEASTQLQAGDVINYMIINH